MATTNVRDPSTWIPKHIFIAYCGADSKTPAAFYDKAVAKKNMMAYSLNWFAILVLPAWFGYRKLWLMLAVFTGMLAAIAPLEALFHFTVPNGAFIGGPLAIGLMANGLLLASAHQTYSKLKGQGLEDAAITERMKDGAKGSVATALIALITCLAFIGGAEYGVQSLTTGCRLPTIKSNR